MYSKNGPIVSWDRISLKKRFRILGKGVVEVALGDYNCDGKFQLYDVKTLEYDETDSMQIAEKLKIKFDNFYITNSIRDK